MKSADHTAKTGAQAASRVFRTFGEIFPDGSVLELVAPSAGEQLDLLLWDRTKILISPEIEHRGKLYRAETLHTSILRATRLPREPAGYGTIRQLFTELAGAFEECLAFSNPAAEQAAFWVLTTWFPECLSSPPALWVSGADIGRAASFFALLHCLCRRALKVAGITRSGFLSLPLAFRPTLLVNQPSLSAGMQELWRESNYRGFFVPGSRGAVLDVSSSKAVFIGMARAATSPSAEHLHLALFPAGRELPSMDEVALTGTAEYFLPRLLKYRLDHAPLVRESKFVPADLVFPIRELARKLGGNCRPFCGSVVETEEQICTAQDWPIRPRENCPNSRAGHQPEGFELAASAQKFGKKNMTSNKTSPAASGWTGL